METGIDANELRIDRLERLERENLDLKVALDTLRQENEVLRIAIHVMGKMAEVE